VILLAYLVYESMSQIIERSSGGNIETTESSLVSTFCHHAVVGGAPEASNAFYKAAVVLANRGFVQPVGMVLGVAAIICGRHEL